MDKLGRTVIAIADAKEAALYFDHVIPLNLGLDILRASVVEDRKRNHQTEQSFPPPPVPYSSVFPVGMIEQLLPPDLQNYNFRNRIARINEITFDIVMDCLAVMHGINVDRGEVLTREAAVSALPSFFEDFNLRKVPVDAPLGFITEGNVEGSEASITLTSLRLVDVAFAPWEQILEFRRDAEAHDKLRRLRLFALENYSDKSKNFIEDDISVRISDYEAATKKWGFNTKYAAFTMILNSKTLAGALAGSLISTLFGAPMPALISASAGAVLEVGRIALEVGKQRFALRDLMAENPVCYISDARSKLRTTARR